MPGGITNQKERLWKFIIIIIMEITFCDGCHVYTHLKFACLYWLFTCHAQSWSVIFSQTGTPPRDKVTRWYGSISTLITACSYSENTLTKVNFFHTYASSWTLVFGICRSFAAPSLIFVAFLSPLFSFQHSPYEQIQASSLC